MPTIASQQLFAFVPEVPVRKKIMANGEAPQGSPVLDQLHQQQSIADSPAQKRSYKQAKSSNETADRSDDSDNLHLQASFPRLPFS